MSCETNANKVSHALHAAGITRDAAKAAYSRAANLRRFGVNNLQHLGPAVGGAVGVMAGMGMVAAAPKIKETAQKAGQKYVDTAKKNVATAKNLADTAKEAAQKAGQKYVDTAKQNAATAKKIADTAKETAQTAGQKYVDTAKKNVATAKKIADTAKETAQTAGETMREVSDRQQDKLAAAAQKAAPVAGRVLNTTAATERTGFPRNALAVGAVALNVPLGKINRMADLAAKTTAALANPAADLSRQSLAGSVVQKRRVLFFFNKKTTVQVWNSSAGNLLNRPDRLVSGKNILAEKSAMLKINGTSWHRGTLTFRAPDGQKRTLTHLQSLNLPARHYYFNRPLSDKETAGLLTRRPGFRADRMDGYLGQVSATEGLSPAWAETKHRIIKTAALSPAGSPPRRDMPRVSFRDVKDAARTTKDTVRAAKSMFAGEK